VTTFVRKVPGARGRRRKSSFFLLGDTPRVFLTRARKGHGGQKSKGRLAAGNEDSWSGLIPFAKKRRRHKQRAK
jgi:hypothetical protein